MTKSHQRTSPEHRPSLVWIALGSILGLYLLHTLFMGRVINDDAFISFRYSWHLAHGNGLVYNPGEHVEGFSNPLHVLLFTLILSIIGWSVPTALAAGKTVGLIAGLITIAGLHGLTREVLRLDEFWAPRFRWPALIPPAVAALSPPLAVSAMTGLETNTLAAWLTLGLWAMLAEWRTGRRRGSSLFFALAVLTRPEGFLLAITAIQGGWIAVRLLDQRYEAIPHPSASRRRMLFSLALVAGTAVLWLTVRLLVFDGELLPNTWYAKSGGFQGETWHQYVLGYFTRYGLFFLPAAAAAAGLLVTRGATAVRLIPVACVTTVHLASFIITGSDWMPGYRLLAPTLPALTALTGVGLLLLLSHLCRRHSRAAVSLWTVYLAAGWFTALCLQGYEPAAELRHHLAVRELGYRNGHLALAHWLSESGSVPPRGTVALMDVGLVGYVNPELRIIDISGLTDRTIGKSPGGFLRKKYDPSYVLSQKPDAVIVTMAGLKGSGIAAGAGAAIDKLEPGTLADRRLYDDPGFKQSYRYERLFLHDHPEITYGLAVWLRDRPPSR